MNWNAREGLIYACKLARQRTWLRQALLREGAGKTALFLF